MMNALPVDRELLVQCLIVVSVTVGAWLIFVQPKANALEELELDIASYRGNAVRIDYDTVTEVAQQAPMLRARANEIREMGRMAQDTSLLYGRIMSLAKMHDVQVRNLRPGIERTRSDRNQVVAVTHIDMTAEGEYEQLARFLDAVHEIPAYLRTVTVQVAPTKRAGGEYTVIQLGFEAIRFALPPVLKQVKGDTRS